MILRKHLPGEEPAIWTVYFRATHESNGRDYHPDLLERWAPRDADPAAWSQRLATTRPTVAIVDGVIAGMAEIDAGGAIDYFYVLPDIQGRGIGTRLMAALETEAAAAGHTRLTADVSVTAKGFFEARGFRVIEARENVILGHPAPNFAMVKQLPPPPSF